MGTDTPLVVLGAGAWGTALAIRAASNDVSVRLWGRDADALRNMQAARVNAAYLPGVTLPIALEIATDLELACAGVSDVLISAPSSAFIELLDAIASRIKVPRIAWACKGLERESGRLLSEVVAARLGAQVPVAVISGPTFAAEVAVGMPTAIVVASQDNDFAQALTARLHQPSLRVYTSEDTIGVQIGGAAKNVLAIAAGISDGLGFGANARAALIARGLAEMARLASACGGRADTMQGLAGLGDLVLSCTDDQSRNRRYGLALGRGANPQDAMGDTAKVVEGAFASRDFAAMASRLTVETPIMARVNEIVWHGVEPRAAVAALLARQPRAE